MAEAEQMPTGKHGPSLCQLGIDIVGPLAADLQSPDLVYMAGSPAASEQPVPAKALIDFLVAPAAAPVYKANGMEPG
jgi:ABC-type molybdate transport system substrate-binding protein